MENIARDLKDKNKKREHSKVEIKEFKNQKIYKGDPIST